MYIYKGKHQNVIRQFAVRAVLEWGAYTYENISKMN